MDYEYWCLLLTFGYLFWFTGTVVYRLYFHPLAKIPGPRLPAATKWYSAYFDCFYHGGGQYAFKLKDLHGIYGPIIRPTPDEVHISDPDFLDTIYALRDRNSTVGTALLVDQSVGATEDFAHHKLRREALNPFFSSKADIESILGDATNDRKGPGRSVFHELRDSPTLPPEEKTVNRLQDEATLLVMAGTESTAKSLGIAVFYLQWQPLVLAKLRGELAEARQRVDNIKIPLSTLLSLPYLGAVINEANRLSFGVTGRSARYAPTTTLTYTASYGPHKGTTYTLPPKTNMSTITYCTHMNESLFPDPQRFDPERFIGSGDEVGKRKKCMHALGKGHRRCVGINLANAALSLASAKLSEYDMELYETDESDVQFKYDCQTSQPKLDSKGLRTIVKGKHLEV